MAILLGSAMDHREFIDRVQHQARLSSANEATRAIRSTLQVFGERIRRMEAERLAALLPEEIGQYLVRPGAEGQPFSVQEFLQRVARTEGVDLPISVHHARSVLSVLQDAVRAGGMDPVNDLLSEEWQVLFDPREEARDEQAG